MFTKFVVKKSASSAANKVKYTPINQWIPTCVQYSAYLYTYNRGYTKVKMYILETCSGEPDPGGPQQVLLPGGLLQDWRTDESGEARSFSFLGSPVPILFWIQTFLSLPVFFTQPFFPSTWIHILSCIYLFLHSLPLTVTRYNRWALSPISVISDIGLSLILERPISDWRAQSPQLYRIPE